MAGARPPVEVGDVLHLRDEDYRYGRGRLVLRVLAVHDVRRFPDGLWVFVSGTEIGRGGRETEQRDVLVRVAALGAARQRPTLGSDGDQSDS